VLFQEIVGDKSAHDVAIGKMAHLLHAAFLKIRSNRFDSLSADKAKILLDHPLTKQSVWNGMSQSRPVCVIRLSQDVRRNQTIQECGIGIHCQRTFHGRDLEWYFRG
jgi:hypothetical protein